MKNKEENEAEATPGPPPREKRTMMDRLRGYHPRLAKPVWMALVGRGGRSWDTWVPDPDGNSKIVVTPPWSEREQHFQVGEGEGAYDISLDEERQVRRVTVYEDMPLAPAWLEKGNWQSVADMAEGVQSFINTVMLERAAEIGATEEGIPPMAWMVFALGVISMAVLIVQAVFG